MATFTTTNPATNKELKTYTYHSDEQVTEVIQNAHQTYNKWKWSSFEERSRLMNKAAEVLENNKLRYAQTMTDEMGKVLSSAVAEVEKCAWVCRYYADHAEEFLADEIVESDATKSKISYRPQGIVLAVMPWNYPFWQVFRFAAPALMAGNVGLLKHASNVPGSALLIQEVFEKAGFPQGCFTTLLIKTDQVKSIIENSKVTATTLTGSGPAGAAVASQSGSNIKKTVLELGGSDPYIILDDADIDLAVDQCVQSRLLNTGQSCIGAKRFIIVADRYDEFLEKFTAKMKHATLGDPNDDVDLGPMATFELRDELHEQVVKSKEAGGNIPLGGYIPDKEGAYYPPTIITDPQPGSPAHDEELFGPVASVFKAKDEGDAIRIANDNKFGLGACVFTEDLKKGERIATEELEAGCCFVNQFVKSDPRLPFGGIKESGYGRELSYYGIREFVNVKTVYIK